MQWIARNVSIGASRRLSLESRSSHAGAGRRLLSRRKAPASYSVLINVHRPYSRPKVFGIGNTDASSSHETSPDRLLNLLGGDKFDSSENVRTGTSLNQLYQSYSNTAKDIDLDFDLYDASCADAAIRSADHCISIITGLDPALRSYLLDQFWSRFNSCIPVVHKGAFLASLEENYGGFCSPELHLAALAMGLRRADQSRADVLQLSLPGWDSILHRSLRQIIDNLSSWNEWRSITYAQAVIILAQLEWERARDHTTRLYLGRSSSKTWQEIQYLWPAGTAFTIIAEIQQRRHDRDTPVSDDEIIVQRIALRAASLIDR